MSKLPLACAASLALLPLTLPGQGWGNTKLLDWRTAQQGQTSLAAAAVTRDGRTHMLIERGGKAIFAYNPAVYSSLTDIALAGTVTGITALPAIGVVPDRFLVTSTQGATLVDPQDDGTFVTTSALDASWNGATGLTVREGLLLGAPFLAIAGIDAGGTKVLAASAGATQVPVTSAIIDVGTQVLEVEVMDWDGDGQKDVLAVLPGGLAIYTITGAYVDAVAGTLTNPATAVLETGSGDRLALLFDYIGLHWLSVQDGQNAETPVLIDMSPLLPGGPTSCAGLAANDCDGDGDTDLLVAHAKNRSLLLLENQGD